MLLELLEKFEDIFTPHTPEEVEKRIPPFRLGFYSIDWNGNFTNEDGVLSQKIVSVKAVDFETAIFNALLKLGIDGSKKGRVRKMSIYSFKPSVKKICVNLTSEDKVFSDRNKLMVGLYCILQLKDRR